MTDIPQKLVLDGVVAPIPYVSGVGYSSCSSVHLTSIIPINRFPECKRRRHSFFPCQLHCHSVRFWWCRPSSLFIAEHLRNDTAFRSYMLSNYISGAVESDVGDLFDTLYPDDPTQGSPFDTGTNFSFPPQYKRLAATQGDLVFQAPRRFFVEQTYNRQPAWSFRTSFVYSVRSARPSQIPGRSQQAQAQPRHFYFWNRTARWLFRSCKDTLLVSWRS